MPRPFDILYPTFVLKPDPEDENTPLRSPDGRCIPAGVGEPGLLVSAIGDRVDRRFDGYTDSMATNKKVRKISCTVVLCLVSYCASQLLDVFTLPCVRELYTLTNATGSPGRLG